MPVFRELMLAVYRDKIVGEVPRFPARMEARITASLLPPDPLVTDVGGDAVPPVFSPRSRRTSPAETHWLLQNRMKVQTPVALPFPRLVPR